MPTILETLSVFDHVNINNVRMASLGRDIATKRDIVEKFQKLAEEAYKTISIEVDEPDIKRISGGGGQTVTTRTSGWQTGTGTIAFTKYNVPEFNKFAGAYNNYNGAVFTGGDTICRPRYGVQFDMMLGRECSLNINEQVTRVWILEAYFKKSKLDLEVADNGEISDNTLELEFSFMTSSDPYYRGFGDATKNIVVGSPEYILGLNDYIVPGLPEATATAITATGATVTAKHLNVASDSKTHIIVKDEFGTAVTPEPTPATPTGDATSVFTLTSLTGGKNYFVYEAIEVPGTPATFKEGLSIANFKTPAPAPAPTPTEILRGK